MKRYEVSFTVVVDVEDDADDDQIAEEARTLITDINIEPTSARLLEVKPGVFARPDDHK